jgi:hypothetical protein
MQVVGVATNGQRRGALARVSGARHAIYAVSIEAAG